MVLFVGGVVLLVDGVCLVVYHLLLVALVVRVIVYGLSCVCGMVLVFGMVVY